MRTFNPKLEQAQQLGNEWQFGAIKTDLALVPKSQRVMRLPEGERQFSDIDSMGCASRAPLNILEMKLNHFYMNGMHPDLKNWLDEKGYRKNGQVVLNDAFIEILSGTTRSGNSLKAPIEAIRKYGVIPDLLPLSPEMTWEEYMNPKRITEEMKELGQQFLRRFTINYEQVQGFSEALKEDSLSAGVFAWPEPVNGVYPKTTGGFNHATALIDDEITSFDGYEPYVKKLAKDYNFFPWAYSISITSQNPYPDEQIALFDTLSRFGLLAFFAEALKRLFGTPIEPLFTPVYPTEKEPEPKPDKIKKLVEVVKNYEGWIPKGGIDASGQKYPNGSRSWRNNNPINAVYVVQYNPIYGRVTSDGRFAVFKTPELGHLYAENFFRSICEGKSATYNAVARQKGYKDGSELSIQECMHIFAPKFENDTKSYLDFISSRFGVPSSTKMSYFVV